MKLEIMAGIITLGIVVWLIFNTMDTPKPALVRVKDKDVINLYEDIQ